MSIADLIFTGFNKRVAALSRRTGEIVWQWTAPSGSSYTTLLLDDDRLIVSVHGYMYALDAMTGRQLWYNEMAGFGYGVASLASVNGHSSHQLTAVAAAQAAARRASNSNGGAGA
jgi:outer membrane protein assembly factor BamB